MKNLLLLLIAFCCAGIGKSQTAETTSLTVMTWNIRYNNPGDGPNAWPNRQERVTAFLTEVSPDILCMQEVLSGQLADVLKACPGYAAFGVGRDDGREAGEYVPVLYQTSRFRLLKGGHFWLSPTPDIAGKKGWDAACARMVSWVKLTGKSQDTLFIFNTHFDHIGQTARLESAKMLTHAVDSLAGNHPAIITGDFNATVHQTPHQVITGAGYADARMISLSVPAGPEYTFTGFDKAGKPGDRIDFIYLKNTKPVKEYLVREDSFNGFYLSDHLPVIVSLER
jgi:endonuclease/exonuclease/phosphatase family metal-dependent hydrolase